MNNKRTIWPILNIDDEWENIADLEQVIDESAVKLVSESQRLGDRSPYHFPYKNLRQYAPNPIEAVNLMRSFQQQRHRFSAIITDNHFKDEDNVEATIRGDDFLRIIQGNLLYCYTKQSDDLDIPLEAIAKCRDFDEVFSLGSSTFNEEVREFSEIFENPEDYASFVNYYFGKNVVSPYLILLCGNPYGADLESLERVEIFQKLPLKTRGGYMLCEHQVLNSLVSSGYLPRECVEESISNHPRLRSDSSPSTRIYRPQVRKNKKISQKRFHS